MKSFLSFVSTVLLLTSAQAERVALVIGNNKYTDLPERMQLTSPVSDAEDVAAALKGLGFTIVTGSAVTNGSKETIIAATEKFATAAKSADAALFYFSGHGIQVGEDNYLLPTDTPKLTGISLLKNRGILLRDSIMVALEEAGVKNKVIVLDCCRDNPFSSQLEAAMQQVGKSLKTKSVGEITGYGPGFYLAFATSPGTTALDGNGARNSPFTAAMLAAIPKSKGLDIDFYFRDVKSRLSDEQVSWTNHSLKDSFTLAVSGLSSPAKEMLRTIPPSAPPHRAMNPINPLENGALGQIYEMKLPGNETMKFCYCPPGTFTMGSPANEHDRGEDEDQVSVTISKGYWLAQTECTQGQWQSVSGKNPSEFTGNPQLPVERVSHEDVQAWLLQASSKAAIPAGWKLVLPTEAQWEYACRAGTQTPFSFGTTLNGKEANCDGNYPYGTTLKGVCLKKTSVVGSYLGNEWGLHDMYGNVWEWCADWYSQKLVGGTDPSGPVMGNIRVNRGGSWNHIAASCRTANRSKDSPGNRVNVLGFRPALVPSR